MAENKLKGLGLFDSTTYYFWIHSSEVSSRIVSAAQCYKKYNYRGIKKAENH